MQSTAAFALMTLLIFFCCAHRSSDSRCFSSGSNNPKIVPSLGGAEPPSDTWLLGVPASPTQNGISIASSVFVLRVHERDRQTDTDRSRYCVCSNRPHLSIAAMRPNIRNFINTTTDVDERRFTACARAIRLGRR